MADPVYKIVEDVGTSEKSISKAIDNVRWSPKTGQVGKRESHLGAAGWPEVRHDEYAQKT